MSYYDVTTGANNPHVVANMDPQGMVGRVVSICYDPLLYNQNNFSVMLG